MVLIQAMAYCRPVIITRTATTEEYVEHGINAYLVPLGDAHALRDAIRLLIRPCAGGIDRSGRGPDVRADLLDGCIRQTVTPKYLGPLGAELTLSTHMTSPT